MTITIFITLFIMMVLSGLIAISPYGITTKSTEDETDSPSETGDTKKYFYYKMCSVIVFVVSLASLIVINFIK